MNKKLIAVRKARKITQADIATYLKISQTQYQKRETGKIKISDQEWKDIARLLDVSVEEIFEEYPNQYLVLQKKIEILKLELKALSLGKNI
ncbi:DNA-binding transcriptional regulator, XRE-family HTH domain [Chryseobacterium oranimense]|uniref:DNA-binding transcriptional regulator, XRE-family HTH domain n=1 Tax=Chryseobacterium oranimense TaxID=421058 RepID=A0A1M5K5B6_9FLAO|nr:helix-turn-helix transcriptional regulator [Chryseobacterium oranimense]SHG47924.1 DNA-binding transcriptional regulator, XRE-family HTH domain [Chryseobacterium oranimense]